MFGFSLKSAVKEVEPSQVAEQLKAGKIHLVDVREKQEWDQARIPGATLMPLSLLPVKAKDLPADKPIVFHCRSGARSAQAITALQNMGLAHDTHMRGGIMAWQSAGLPITT